MHYLKLVICFCFFAFSSLFAVQDQLGSVEPFLEGKETLTKEMTIPGLDFEKLSKLESECNKRVSKMTHGDMRAAKRLYHKALVLCPITQGHVIVNGTLCHVANYPRSSIVTVLDGPYFGLQTTVAPNGLVLIVNNVCFVDSTPSGIVLRHEYPDSTVLTAREQVIILH